VLFQRPVEIRLDNLAFHPPAQEIGPQEFAERRGVLGEAADASPSAGEQADTSMCSHLRADLQPYARQYYAAWAIFPAKRLYRASAIQPQPALSPYRKYNLGQARQSGRLLGSLASR